MAHLCLKILVRAITTQYLITASVATAFEFGGVIAHSATRPIGGFLSLAIMCSSAVGTYHYRSVVITAIAFFLGKPSQRNEHECNE